MKTLYLIGGTMGAGKTTVCRILRDKLDRSVFLDGDWCWDMHPFQVTEETKKMVMENISFLLNSFLRCSAYDHVVFCWVMHQQSILDDLLARLDTADCRVRLISLTCAEEALRKRLQKDVDAGIRTPDVIGRSVERLGCYEALQTEKIDVSRITPVEAAEKIWAGNR